MDLSLSFIVSAFVAGFLTFLAPCTFPLLPGYLGIITGRSPGQISHGEHKLQAIRSGFAFVLGFTFVFVSFGLLAGLLGKGLQEYREILSRLGGVLVTLFGLSMIGIIRPNYMGNLFNRMSDANLRFTKRVSSKIGASRFSKLFDPGHPLAAFAVGVTFSLGWTACLGQVLGAIVILASSTATAFNGLILMLVFSLGLAIPFMLVAAFAEKVVFRFKKFNKHLGTVTIIGGILLVIIGLSLVFDRFGLLAQLWFRLFGGLEYDRILDYL